MQRLEEIQTDGNVDTVQDTGNARFRQKGDSARFVGFDFANGRMNGLLFLKSILPRLTCPALANPLENSNPAI